ncbi:MAG: EF-hand domain-containing protein [Planctomycetes bacterium]|nr:EF-hand domain-containing protein [Planctomycetota bacterium]
MSRLAVLILTSCLLSPTLLSAAAAPDGGKARAKGMLPMSLVERLDRLGGNGKEGDDALAAWAARIKEKRPDEFAKLDADGDGTISPAEAKAARDHAEELLKDNYPELFARFDTDHDGHLSHGEVQAAREALRAARKDRPAEGHPEPGSAPGPAALPVEVKDHPTGPAPKF